MPEDARLPGRAGWALAAATRLAESKQDPAAVAQDLLGATDEFPHARTSEGEEGR